MINRREEKDVKEGDLIGSDFSIFIRQEHGKLLLSFIIRHHFPEIDVLHNSDCRD